MRQTRTIPLSEPEAICVESCEKTMARRESTKFSNCSFCKHSPVLTRQIRTMSALEPDANRTESCANATESTHSLWPRSLCIHSPVSARQTRTEFSSEPAATSNESPAKAIEADEDPCASKVCRDSPVPTCHICTTVFQTVTDASSAELCEKYTAAMSWLRPCNVRTHSPVTVLQIRTVPLSEPEATSFESWRKLRNSRFPYNFPTSVYTRQFQRAKFELSDRGKMSLIGLSHARRPLN